MSIWRPNTNKKLPVFVWIYGGVFHGGECSDSMYDGSNFARNDVLYVSFNCRIGVLGYYDFSKYDKDNFDSNCDVSDQIAALKWSKENIAAFGGDENNITIAGESAGGTSVGIMLAAPLAKGLFHKAICQSGPLGAVHVPPSARKNLDIFLEQLKLDTKDIIKLRTMPAAHMKQASDYLQSISAVFILESFIKAQLLMI